MFFLYSTLYCITWLLLFPLSLISKKIRLGLFGRFGLKKRILKLPKGDWIWFHIASAGELEQALPILDALKRKSTSRIFISYFSPTAKKAIELEQKRRAIAQVGVPWDAADFSPFEFIFLIKPIVLHLKPKVFVAVHREIWPALLTVLNSYRIPCLLAPTFWPIPSQRRLGFLKTWLGDFKKIGCVDEASAIFLRQHVTADVLVLGEPRIDRVLQRKALQKNVPPWKDFFASPTIVLASIWEEDVAAINYALPALLNHPLKPRLLFVPHEFHHPLKVNVPTRLWSHWLSSPDMHSHLMVDAVGFLAELYQVADLVFVGGSFKSRVHNVLEPTAYGKPILTGPKIQNSMEAMEMAQTQMGLIACSTEKELERVFLMLLDDKKALQEMGLKAKNYIESRKGASERYAELVMHL